MATIHQMNRGLGDGTSNSTLFTIGATGEAVKTLQQQLNKLRATFIAIPEDGVYTNDTANAVKAFQGKNNLNVTGSVDSATRDALVAAAGAITVVGTNSLASVGSTPLAKPKFALWQLGLMVAGGLARVGGALWVVTRKDEEDKEDLVKPDEATVKPLADAHSHVKVLTKPTKVKAQCSRTPDEKQLTAGEILLPMP